MTRTTIGVAIAVAAIAAASGVSAQQRGVTASEVVFGMPTDLSGPAATYGVSSSNGVKMRFEEANEAGGINGRKLRLVIEDNASQPSQAVRAVDKLIRKDEVFALLCPFGSGPNVATVKKAVDAGVVCFAPYAASGLVRQAAGQTPLLFTTNLNYDSTTSAAVKWATGNLGSKKVGFIYQEGPFGDLVGKGVKAALAAKGAPLAAEASYKVGDLDFSSHVARMQAAVHVARGQGQPAQPALLAPAAGKVGSFVQLTHPALAQPIPDDVARPDQGEDLHTKTRQQHGGERGLALCATEERGRLKIQDAYGLAAHGSRHRSSPSGLSCERCCASCRC